MERGRSTSRHKNVEVVAALMEAGADVEAPGAGGARPLHFAALSGCAATMGALLELGVDIHAVDGDGLTSTCTPLHYATSSGAVQSLLEAGADLHRRDTSGSIRLCFKQPSTAMLRR
jgi:hypothetical protein